jgi:dihydrofolate reductase
MRPLILKVSMSVDGLIGGPNGELDWIFRTMDAQATEWTVDTLANAGLHVMGSAAYEGMSVHWPFSSEPFAKPMNTIPKLFFSSRAERVSEAAAHAVAAANAERAPEDRAEQDTLDGWTGARGAADISAEITALKHEDGKPILAHGGASFLQALIALGLVDEYRLLVHPVALGDGPRLFPASAPFLDLNLVNVQVFAGGATGQVFRSLTSRLVP